GKSFSLNRRSTVRQRVCPLFPAADRRDSSGKRRQRKKLAARKLDRVVFKRRPFIGSPRERRAPMLLFLSRHFRRGRQNTDRAIGTRVERSRCRFRKKFTAASSRGSARELDLHWTR